MSEKTVIALDAMGGDNAPDEIVKGAVEAVAKSPDMHVVLVGRKEVIEPALKKYGRSDRISIKEASQVIETGDHPVQSIRGKKDSSIVVGLKLVKDHEADAFVSAGNSGAVLVGGQVIVGRVPGVERAPFAALLPTEAGFSLLLDSGANVDARSDHLVSFAKMGSIYMRDVMGVSSPSVGIINIGVEEEKGNALVKETFPLLAACNDIDFKGSVEARDIPAGGCDVLVCEAFTGNVVLKMYEGTAASMLRIIKKGLMSSLMSKIGGALIKPALKKTLKDYDGSRLGGAPLLGLKGLVMKTHGSSKAMEVTNTLLQCVQFKKNRIAEKIADAMTAAGDEKKGE